MFSGNVSSVVMPGILGNFGVYPDHAPLISILKKGDITYMDKGIEKSIQINGGLAEVNNGVVTVCVS